MGHIIRYESYRMIHHMAYDMDHMVWSIEIKAINTSSIIKNRGAPGFRCMLHDLSLVDLKGTTLNQGFGGRSTIGRP